MPAPVEIASFLAARSPEAMLASNGPHPEEYNLERCASELDAAILKKLDELERDLRSAVEKSGDTLPAYKK